jgi:hypothetical protein
VVNWTGWVSVEYRIHERVTSKERLNNKVDQGGHLHHSTWTCCYLSSQVGNFGRVVYHINNCGTSRLRLTLPLRYSPMHPGLFQSIAGGFTYHLTPSTLYRILLPSVTFNQVHAAIPLPCVLSGR